MPKSRLQVLLVSFVSFVAFNSSLLASTDSEQALLGEISALRQSLAEKEAALSALRHQSDNGSALAHADGRALALSVEHNQGQALQNIAPSSTLSKDKARKAASAAHYMVNGSSLMTVMPTGSMKPMFDENAVLLIEPANFDELKVGDIITYKHPSHQMPVVHRIIEKRGDQFLTKGDNNGRMDECVITRENFQGRVFGVIFAKEAAF